MLFDSRQTLTSKVSDITRIIEKTKLPWRAVMLACAINLSLDVSLLTILDLGSLSVPLMIKRHAGPIAIMFSHSYARSVKEQTAVLIGFIAVLFM
jgi:hypothetical protein